MYEYTLQTKYSENDEWTVSNRVDGWYESVTELVTAIASSGFDQAGNPPYRFVRRPVEEGMEVLE